MTDAAFDLMLTGATVVSHAGRAVMDIGVRGGRIAAMGALGPAAARERIALPGLHLLPGVIDTQVHFREPGSEHKEDLASGTAAAALGGVVALFEMPNTKPSTTTAEALADKLLRASGRAAVDHAFYIGASSENAEQLAGLERLPGCCGVKIFMGSSTGSLLVPDDATLARVLRSGTRRVAVHAEDEARLVERRPLVAGAKVHPREHPHWRDPLSASRATERLLHLARTIGRRVHVLHISTAEELELLRGCRDFATVEALPNHLTLHAPDCYNRLGTYAQMNPPVRSIEHQQALWRAIADGTIDVLGTDHAPHTRAEKDQPYPASPSGMPGVQTLVPVMLTHVANGRLTLERFVDLTSAGPQRVFGLAGKGRIACGYDADFTVVDLKAERTITDQEQRSKVGWTPFAGMRATGWPVMTIIRGQVVMRDGALVGPPRGAPMRFLETLPTGV